MSSDETASVRDFVLTVPSNEDALKNVALFDRAYGSIKSHLRHLLQRALGYLGAEWENPSRNRDWHYKAEAIRELQSRVIFLGHAASMYTDAARGEIVALRTEVLLMYVSIESTRRAELELDIENQVVY
ncbi:hypothetical protein EXIGLDRAFT_775211 [Exidia glandulosa HHB12029]|uniref:Uncharacterized protein n=1 Tax=Exidia glandulosa HHB12029 TaxID=1314781 RepID=A0A165E0F3_EXIGL|nr:hypothetical protein EXIGLDRAFT_775211 [Exidia glandulosa HHB12029]